VGSRIGGVGTRIGSHPQGQMAWELLFLPKALHRTHNFSKCSFSEMTLPSSSVLLLGRQGKDTFSIPIH
jgi:hypothetical protein